MSVIYSSKGTPKGYRPRRYTIICSNGVTAEEFSKNCDRAVRMASETYNTPFAILDDVVIIEALRSIGISPTRITIYCTSEPAHNPYGYVVQKYPDQHAIAKALIAQNTHDITWSKPGLTYTFPLLIERLRKEKNAVEPFVDEIY